jgi:hypothetical protein
MDEGDLGRSVLDAFCMPLPSGGASRTQPLSERSAFRATEPRP